MGYKNLYTSRGDGNSQQIWMQVGTTFCIRTYIPWEGTETNKCSYTWNTPICIRAYLPCEGTETCIASHSSFSIWILGIRTYLPREGTETHWLFSFWFNRFNCIRTYLPRQGTETHRNPFLNLNEFGYKNLSTSRGDGNQVEFDWPKTNVQVNYTIHLARGRKLYRFSFSTS